MWDESRKTSNIFNTIRSLSVASLVCFTVLPLASTVAMADETNPDADSAPSQPAAESECGTIGIPFFDTVESFPIEDCANPFGIEEAAPDDWYALRVNGQTIEDNAEFFVAAGTEVTGTLSRGSAPSDVMHHAVRVYYEDESGLELVYSNWIQEFPADELFSADAVQEGTYHILLQPVPHVFQVQAPQSQPWWSAVAQSLVPRVQAQAVFSGAQPVWHRTVTLQQEEVLDGPPSVLFLPGIQASRLYEADGEELDQVWPPTNNDDVRALAMTESGESERDIRTRDVVDEVLVPVLGTDVYKTFLATMEEAVVDGTVADFAAYAYDWRHSVVDIVEQGTVYSDGETVSLVAEVERLAESSGNGQVVVIGHSNGGLLAKALTNKLAEIGKADLLESVVFVGVPHLGTPKALATLLHGYDQEKLGGLAVDDATARAVMRDMPGAYPLLPSARYLELYGSTVYFADSTSTAPWVNQYGYELNTYAQYQQFLTGQDAGTRAYGESQDIHIPSALNSSMVEQAHRDHQDSFATWTPPAAVEAYNIVGTGVATVEAVRYRELRELQCPPGAMHVLAVCSYTSVLKPFVQFTTQGDETVVSRSAAYGDEVETVFVDLLGIESEKRQTITHANFLESDAVLSILKNIFNKQNLSNIDYIFNSEPLYENPLNLAAIDSPVTFYATDQSGRRAGKVDGAIVEEIPGSAYFEIGETKYLLLPEDIDHTMTLEGEADGYYTYSLGSIQNGEQTIETRLTNATTTQNMVATYEVENGSTSALRVDYAGDGGVDLEQTLDGEIVNASSTSTSEDGDSESVVSGGGGTLLVTKSDEPTGTVAGVSIESGAVRKELLEQFVKALEQYLVLLKQYENT